MSLVTHWVMCEVCITVVTVIPAGENIHALTWKVVGLEREDEKLSISNKCPLGVPIRQLSPSFFASSLILGLPLWQKYLPGHLGQRPNSTSFPNFWPAILSECTSKIRKPASRLWRHSWLCWALHCIAHIVGEEGTNCTALHRWWRATRGWKGC